MLLFYLTEATNTALLKKQQRMSKDNRANVIL